MRSVRPILRSEQKRLRRIALITAWELSIVLGAAIAVTVTVAGFLALGWLCWQ